MWSLALAKPVQNACPVKLGSLPEVVGKQFRITDLLVLAIVMILYIDRANNGQEIMTHKTCPRWFVGQKLSE